MSVKLALVGKNISHSLSPQLQKEIWGDKLSSYDLIDVDNIDDLPSLQELAKTYQGINITTPYKEAYVGQVEIESEVARQIGAINTISLIDMSAINSDAVAVEKILKQYFELIPRLKVHLLGDGVMARMTVLVCQKLEIDFDQYTRKAHGDLTHLDLSMLNSNDLVINSCSRSFVFKGAISSDCHFWDYNYSFPQHSDLSHKVKSYQDGQPLLRDQAISAAEFWQQKSKINY